MTAAENTSPREGACWRCDERLGLSAACHACDAPQSLPAEVDHFTVLGLPRSLVVDPVALERSYHEAARRVHPDRHQTADPRAIELSVTTSAALNRAFRVLREPVTRGRYWLALHGTPLGKDNNQVPPALAMLVFETQEQLEALRDRPSESARAATESARRDVAAQLDTHLAGLADRYRTWDTATEADALAELKERLSEIAYLKTLLDDVEEALGSLMARVVGIDLGTTNSLVAVLGENGRPTILPCPETGDRLLPSAVSFPPDGPVLVGRSARARSAEEPLETILSVKRFMGLGAEHLSDDDRARYRFATAGDGPVRFDLHGVARTPPEISAHVLRELKRWAEAALGETVEQAVITVPAYFNDTQRQATRDAGRLAGLEVLRLVNEPTAAALAYGLDEREDTTIAVYDLGGGTFDLSILKLAGGVFQVLATGGDTRLGGDDLDVALARRLLRELPEQWHDHIQIRAQLLDMAERVKQALSERDAAPLELALPEGGTVSVTITRAEFEDLVRPIIERTTAPCRQALKDAGLSAADVDAVVAVGGSTRVPLVRRHMQEIFGREPLVDLDPDEVVALGAGIQAGVLTGRKGDMLLLDVVPLSLGIETMGGVFSRLIDRNTTIPVGVKETFTTATDGQSSVDINVFQGEREIVTDNRRLADFRIPIDPMPAGVARLEVMFLVDANGILSVTARDLRTGLEKTVDVKPTYGLGDDELERMLEESIDHAEEDVRERMLREARVDAETILNATRAQLERHGAVLEAGEGERIVAAAQVLEAAAAGEDHLAIHDAYHALSEISEPFARRIMDGALQDRTLSHRVEDI